jgi:hypothetical protein
MPTPLTPASDAESIAVDWADTGAAPSASRANAPPAAAESERRSRNGVLGLGI